MKKLVIFGFFYIFCATSGATSKIELRLNHIIVIQNKDIEKVIATQNTPSKWTLTIKLIPNATKIFAALTKNNIGKKYT